MAQPATYKLRHFGWPLILIALLSGGCSGINASKSVSPLDFLLPGLHMRNDSPPPVTPAETNALVCSVSEFSPISQ